MEMKRCTAAILLVLSLEALVAGRLSAAVADDGVDTIRLPSHGLADERENGGEKKRPWKCCDKTFCDRRMPPGCRCMDPVERCDGACERCEASKSDPSKHICMDRYRGHPGPSCTKPGNAVGDGDDNVPNGPGVAGQDARVAVAVAATEGPRPWRCCNRPLCTRSNPPTCRCLDDVDRCASTCKVCAESIFDPDSHECQDEHTGDPGPRCTSRLLNSTGKAEAASKKSVANGEEQARPWKCCDDSLCTRSAPPTCFCRDKVKKCAKTCKVCEKADEPNGASPRYVCRDSYFGWSPRCTKPVAADVRRGN